MFRMPSVRPVLSCCMALLPGLCAQGLAQGEPSDDRESLSFDDLTFWRGLVSDRDEFREGIQSGAWNDTVANDRVRYKNVTLDASDAIAARFWLHSRTASGAKIALVLGSENPATDGFDYYFGHVTIDFTGWREVTIPFSEMGIRRHPAGFSSITEIIFASTGYGCGEASRETALRLDDLRFVDSLGKPTATAGGVVPNGFEDLFGFEDGLLWSGLVLDSDSPAHGRYSCRWEHTDKTTRIYASRFPGDISAFDALGASVWSGEATGAQIALLLYSENTETAQPDFFLKHLAIDWTGWREVEIPLSEFETERSPVGMNAITGFRMASEGYRIEATSPATVLKFDNMRLVPKKGGETQ